MRLSDATRRDLAALSHGLNVFLGLALIVSSIGLSLVSKDGFMWAYFHDFFPLWLPLPGSSFYFYYVYPVSITMLGYFLILFDMKHGWKALPLLVMGAGLFDVLLGRDMILNVLQGQPWPVLQTAMAVGGWLFAKMPRVSFSSNWFLLLLATFVATNYGLDYRAFEAALYGFILMEARWK